MKSELDHDNPLRKLFDGIIEQVFMVDLGICEPGVTEYLGRLLADFIHMDRIYRLRGVDGAAIRELSRMEAEAVLAGVDDATARTRLVNQYIGDFTLFWTGVYPEHLRARFQGGIDRLHPYLVQGKRSYGIASELSDTGVEPPAGVLQQLSEQFEYCVHGLHLVRASWERLAEGPGEN
jgi:hypothetical protein